MSGLTLFEHRLTIDAPARLVFELLTTPRGLLRWIAVRAEVDRVVDGRITWTHENGDTMVGRIIALEPPTRIVFTYGWEDGAMGVPAESTTVEITLTERTRGDQCQTELYLLHRHLPEDAKPRHGLGWRHFLSAMREAAERRRVI